MRRKKNVHRRARGRRPYYDSARGELRAKGLLVKQFRQPATAQRLILEAFQEENWPEVIDDPLPPIHGTDEKRRLNAAIGNLNRYQLNPLLRFRGAGMGTKIRWQWRN